ncbi:hypothetical protein [Intrasporangium calvum]|uniref:hypothetical protein n=1 Tax=Intrasporangium calvum TaxID=53358 RepID=UPI000DF5F914|nr:hypothetical protein [Intrasporangium calvum]AXG12145.1 hypothetical protein DN585_00665 [Intrasporangium calvum]
MTRPFDSAISAIRMSGPSLYDPPVSADSPLYLTNDHLEAALSRHMLGRSLAGLPLRTRSKVAKTLVCEALGYDVPASFRKSQPRFPHPNFDLYVQKSNNLQIWNEEVDPERRYVVLGLDDDDSIAGVRVVTGQELALLDTTGTLTSKYQASRRKSNGSTLVNPFDTLPFVQSMKPVSALEARLMGLISPVSVPRPGTVLSISAIYSRLLQLIGREIQDPGATQERLRGVELQRLICSELDLAEYADGGQFPDILSQALEVKLQLSPTVDLGLVSPDSAKPVLELGEQIAHRDMRYAVVYAERIDYARLRVTEVVVCSGAHFFDEFRRFEGRVQNRKLQIRLPRDFFEITSTG